MRRKRPHVASLDEVRITREAEAAVIEYADPSIWTTHLTLGPRVHQMTDQEILACFNEGIEAQQELAASYEHVAVEIPIGKPQLEFHERGNQWTPRGGVLRCLIEDGGPDGEATIEIDDHELSMAEFGRMLKTYAGWGMRIIFVPDDEVHETPTIEVREPDKDRR